MAPGGVKVVRTDVEDGEILTKEELAEVRELLRVKKDLTEIAEGKKASVWVWKQVGALAKWIGIVIAAIVAVKAAFLTGGGQHS